MMNFFSIFKFYILCMSSDSSIAVEDEVSKTTAVINFKGSVDVMVSPLMLEALQR